VINKFYLLCVIFSGSPDLTLKTCLLYSYSQLLDHNTTIQLILLFNNGSRIQNFNRRIYILLPEIQNCILSLIWAQLKRVSIVYQAEKEMGRKTEVHFVAIFFNYFFKFFFKVCFLDLKTKELFLFKFSIS